MPRFFVRQDQITDEIITVTGQDAFHISHSLRMSAGEHITVCDMQRREYDCILEEFGDDKVCARIYSVTDSQNEPPCFITLFQALPKGDKLDTVIQKAVECGVGRIVPFESERCVVRMKPEAEAKKCERRNRISAEAAKQCGRSIIPEVAQTVSFKEMTESAHESDYVFFCYEGDGTVPIGKLLNTMCINDGRLSGKKISVIIGSEGGFSLDEAETARKSGFMMAGLGKRILRTETASSFVLACIACITELS